MILTDLHIHSCLSPCADDTMTPAAIVKAAKEAGLELIAITDHNSARNCPAVAAEAEKAGIGFIPGIEVTTSEEIHCVCLLPDLGKAAAFSRWLDTLRPGIANRPNVFGRQTVIGSRGSRTEERELLFMARRISVNELSRAVRQYSGLICPLMWISRPTRSIPFSAAGRRIWTWTPWSSTTTRSPRAFRRAFTGCAARTRTGSGISRADIRSRSRAPISPD